MHEELLALLVRANQLNAKKDYRGALRLYREAVDRFGPSPYLLMAVAQGYFDAEMSDPRGTGEEHKLAVEWARRAVAAAPHDSFLRERLGFFLWLGTLEHEAAATELREALRLNPDNLGALLDAAALYGLPEDVVSLEEAIGWLERAVEIQPGDPAYHLKLGDLYEEAGRTDDALAAWYRALLCPASLEPRFANGIPKRVKSLGRRTRH